MNGLAPDDDIEKFNEWAEKVESLLGKTAEDSEAYLPAASQWLMFRAKKIRDKKTEYYKTIVDRYVRLSKESAKKQSAKLLKDLDKAKKHKLGTRVRIDRILSFTYHFAHYAYPNFIEGNAQDELRKILSSFWNEYLREIVEYRELINDRQISWLTELAELSEEVGIRPDTLEVSMLRMEMAKRHPRRNRSVSNIALMEQLAKDIAEWETHSVEFKKRATSDNELAQAIAAFATANPGRVYIGIKPDKTIEGVEINANNGRDIYQLKIARITNDIIRPKIRVKLYFIVPDAKKTVVRIDVPKGTEPVYYADYRPYIRYLSQTRKMEPSEVKETYENYFRVKETSVASTNLAEGQLVNDFLKQYSDKSMLEALRVLDTWQKEQGIDFDEKWIQLLRQGDSKALEVDVARRKVSHYFQNALSLYEKGYASARFMEIICGHSGIDIFYKIVEPLERAQDREYDKKPFAKLRQICPALGIKLKGSLPVPAKLKNIP